MENASLLWENLKCPQLFTLCLNNVDSLVSSIDHLVSRLEADEFWEAERLRQERYNWNQLKQACCLLRIATSTIFDLYRVLL